MAMDPRVTATSPRVTGQPLETGMETGWGTPRTAR
jgi:hypothetical protein